MRRLIVRSLSIVLLIGGSACFAEDYILKRGGIAITADEFERFARAILPAEQFENFHHNEKAGRELLAELFLMKTLAGEAVAEGMDSRPDIQSKLEAARIRLLAQERLQEVAAASKLPDLESLAKEDYLTNRERYRQPEVVSASHILIALSDSRDELQARSRAQGVFKKLKAGGDFATLAKEYSDDPSARDNGGNLGSFQRGQMVKSFEDAVFSMKEKGQISDPVKTQFGYHIIRFDDRKEARIPSFEEIKPQLLEQAKAKALQEARNRKVESIRMASDIKVNESAVKAFFSSSK